jgi:hypothetical protein
MALADLRELRRKHREQEKILVEAERRAGINVHREKDAERKRQERAEQRVVIIPKCENRDRREELEANDVEWLMHYYGPESGLIDPFTYRFTTQQLEMIEAFGHVMQFGGDQSAAASRGEGKTTILERLISKYTLQGKVGYTVLFQATCALAENSLDSIKTGIEENALLYVDYPEACYPIAGLRNSFQRAQYQYASGFRHDNGEPYERASTRFTWCHGEAIFPKVPGSPSTGAIINTRGLDSAVRGLKKRGRRPELAAIDDPDTQETARNQEQADKLSARIDSAIGGLGGQKRAIGRIMLCTIPSRVSVAFKYTNLEEKPSWKGKRFRYLIKEPTRADLWEQYVRMYADDFRAYARGESPDKHCRRSHNFFIENRAAMEEGAVVANENRFNPDILPDGSQVELSALQHYYNAVARLGKDHVSTEYDNDPPKISDFVESGITARAIQVRLSGHDRCVVPDDCTVITQGIDVQKMGLHWVIKAWRPDATNFVIDYGYFETHGTTYNSDEGVENAIYKAIVGRMEQIKERPYHRKNDGEILDVNLTLIDSGWQAETVYKACYDLGLGVYPAKGRGKSQGCVGTIFSPAKQFSETCRPGDGWRMDWQPLPDIPPGNRGVWLVNCDTDRWKGFEHARWMTAEGLPGASYIFGSMTDDERYYLAQRLPRESSDHHGFARHLTAEIETEEEYRGTLRRVWKTKASRVQNHWFDASYLADVAGSMMDIQVLRAQVQEEETKKPAVISAGRPSPSRW